LGGDYLVIGIARIDHGHEANHPGMHKGERNHRFLAEHQNIERIVIFGERLRDETVVRGIKDGGIKNAVNADYSTGFVELVPNVRVAACDQYSNTSMCRSPELPPYARILRLSKGSAMGRNYQLM
jgi:hypothetical protein